MSRDIWDQILVKVQELGGDLLSSDYKAVKAPLDFRCTEILPNGEVCGNLYTRVWDRFKRSPHPLRCDVCVKTAQGLAKAAFHAPQDISAEVESRGAKLLSPYTHSKIPLTLQCQTVLPDGKTCNRVFERSWDKLRIQRLLQCSQCAAVLRGKGKSSNTLPKLVAQIEERGSKLLSIYKSSKSPITVACSASFPDGNICGAPFEIIPNNVKRSIILECRECSKRRIYQQKSDNQQKYDLVEEIAKRSAELIPGTYVRNYLPMQIRCLQTLYTGEICGVVFERPWAAIIRAEVIGCAECTKKLTRQKMVQVAQDPESNITRFTLEQVRGVFSSFGAELLTSEFNHSKESLTFRCSTEGCDNTHTTSFACVQSYNVPEQVPLRCKQCSDLARPRGSSHPLYKEDKEPHRGWKFTAWSEVVLALFNRACWIAGVTEETLHAHHLDAWQAFPESRFLINNGVALSITMHGCHHGWCVRNGAAHGFNTKDHFAEWCSIMDIPKFVHPLTTVVSEIVEPDQLYIDRQFARYNNLGKIYVPIYTAEATRDPVGVVRRLLNLETSPALA